MQERLSRDAALSYLAEEAGKRRKHYMPEKGPVFVEIALAGAKWQEFSWRHSTKWQLTSMFAAHCVRVAGGHSHLIGNS